MHYRFATPNKQMSSRGSHCATVTMPYIVRCLKNTSTTAPTDHVDSDKIDDNVNDEANDEYCSGYPRHPFLLTLAHRLAQWITTNQFPIRFQPFEHMEEDIDYYRYLHQLPMDQWKKQFNVDVRSMSEVHIDDGDDDTEQERDESLETTAIDSLVGHVLTQIGVRGILTLLHVRKTAGSIDYFPPTKAQLLASFNDTHMSSVTVEQASNKGSGSKSSKKSTSMLTVGARALAKHCHRSVTDQWWGSITGSESDKNEHANRVLHRILSSCTFINCHLLPHDIPCIEVRTGEGYGARWVFARGNPRPDSGSTVMTDTSDQSDQIVFRGFLEPHDPTGHEKGWRH